jgi:hypothetical protein
VVQLKLNLKEKIRLGDIDFSYLNTITEGDFEFLSNLVEVFINNTPHELDLLESEVRNKNFSGVTIRAHALKSNFLDAETEDNLKVMKHNVMGIVEILKQLNAA